MGSFCAKWNTEEEDLLNKDLLRTHFLAVRRDISTERRKKASEDCLIDLKAILAPFQKILSFHSVKSEIDLLPLNTFLLSEERLYIASHKLEIFQVRNLSLDLQEAGKGFFEPNPFRCKSISLEEIDAILVPALAFDLEGRRLGYGKGHYDQILSKISPHVLTIGVAFQEQLSKEPLPEESHDQRVLEVRLF